MSHPLSFMIESILRRSEKNGELENLPGAGKPLERLDNPQDAVLNKLLKEAGAKPPIVVLKEEINEAQARLKTLTDEDEVKSLKKKLSELQMRLAMKLEAFRKFG